MVIVRRGLCELIIVYFVVVGPHLLKADVARICDIEIALLDIGSSSSCLREKAWVLSPGVGKLLLGQGREHFLGVQGRETNF